jgi:hypothetical protein
MKWFWQQYLGDGSEEPHAYAAPLLAPSFSKLPPAVMVAAECDPLASDSASFAHVLRRDGSFHREGRLELVLRALLLSTGRVVFLSSIRPRFYKEGVGIIPWGYNQYQGEGTFMVAGKDEEHVQLLWKTAQELLRAHVAKRA